MAGGSCAAVPVSDPQLLADLTTMQPVRFTGGYMLEGPHGKLILRNADEKECSVALDDGSYTVHQVNAMTGQVTDVGKARESVVIAEKGIFWIKKN